MNVSESNSKLLALLHELEVLAMMADDIFDSRLRDSPEMDQIDELGRILRDICDEGFRQLFDVGDHAVTQKVLDEMPIIVEELQDCFWRVRMPAGLYSDEILAEPELPVSAEEAAADVSLILRRLRRCSVWGNSYLGLEGQVKLGLLADDEFLPLLRASIHDGESIRHKASIAYLKAQLS